MTPLSIFLRSRYGVGSPDRASLSEYQHRGIRHLRKHIMPRSPYYAAYANKPRSEWPLMNKVHLMEHFTAINTAGITKENALDIALASERSRDFSPMIGEVAVGLSTGTSGQRGLFASNRRERSLWAVLMLGRFMPSLLRRQRIAFFLRANNKLYERLSNPLVAFEFYDLLKPFERYLKQLNEQNPTVLIAPAQILGCLARAQLNQQITIAPLRVISVAEVLSPEDAFLIEQAFCTKVDQVYQCTEGVLGMTCRAGGFHLNEAHICIERDVIDAESGAFCPIITDLNRETLPIINYRLDDVLIPDKEPCTCGCTSLRLKRIEGRYDDILYWDSDDGSPHLIPSDAIRQAIATAATGVLDYRAMQHGTGRLEIWLETPQFEQACMEVGRNLEEQARIYKARMPMLSFYPGIDIQLAQKRRRVIACR